MPAAHKLDSLQRALLVASLLLQPWVSADAGSASKHLTAARAELARRSDADSLAAAGLLTAQYDRQDALSLVSRAANAAPERADLVWLNIMLCQAVPSCDSDALEHRLRELDPANGAGWLATLVRARASHDEAASSAALDGLARSEQVDIYYTTLVSRLGQATYDSGKVPLAEALVAIIGVLGAQAIPAYQLTSSSCMGDALGTPAAIERCRGIARSLERGDTYITQMIGIAIAKRVWPEDSSEWKSAADARHLFEYRSQLSLGSYERPGPRTESLKRYLTLCREYAREQDVLRQQIIDAGGNPDPPGTP